MANNYITSGSRFRPYTFAEMLQPVQIYTEAYNKVEDELANLDILAEDVAGKLNNPADKELSNKALTFQTELTRTMNELYEKGLNPTTRRQLAGLKARYAKELNPINEAYKAYLEDQKQVTNLRRTHPGLIVEGIGASVSDYMYGNTPSGITANTDDIYNKSLKAAAGTSSRFSQILSPTGILGDQYYEFKTQQGISQNMVRKLRDIIDNPTSKTAQAYLSTNEGRALYNIVTEQRKANNYDSFSEGAQDRIDASILSGIFSGVSYKEDVDRVSNKDWVKTPPPDVPPIDTSGMYYREVPRVETDGKTPTSTIAEDREFLRALKSNPEMINDIWKDAHYKQIGSSVTGHVQNITVPAVTYLDRLQELSKEYGLDFNVKDVNGNITIEGVNSAINKLNEKIDKAAVAKYNYVLNMTDYDLASQIITGNVNTISANSGNRDYSGLTDLNGDPILKKNQYEYLEGEKSIYFDPYKGVVLVTLKNDKVKYAVVDPWVLDGTGTLANRIALTKQAMEKENYALANIFIKGSSEYGSGIMTLLYNIFNSVPEVQGKTDSKLN